MNVKTEFDTTLTELIGADPESQDSVAAETPDVEDNHAENDDTGDDNTVDAGDEPDTADDTESGEGDAEGADDEDEDEVAQLRATVESLREEILRLSQPQHQNQTQAQMQQPEQSQTQTPLPDSAPADPFADLDDDAFYDMTQNREDFVNRLNQYGQRIAYQATEQALRAMPEVVQKYAAHQVVMQKTVDKFYGENPHLDSVRPYVAKVATTVQAEHPDWDMGKILEETAKRAEKALSISKDVKNKAKTVAAGKKQFAKPRGGGGTRTPKQSESVDPMQQDILDMLK